MTTGDAEGSGAFGPVWRVEYNAGPEGGYRLVFTLDPQHPPKRAGKCWRATLRGARRRAEQLNAMDWSGQLALPFPAQPRRRRGRRGKVGP